MKVTIGRYPMDGDRQASLDIERLVESRAFIQASSGFGKSYLLCELIEATHGHIQQLIIDPEGEFSPLRKDHDFVIAAAHGGDAIAHPRTAALLATRLLETKASAILDIYDVKPRERHEFVRNFLVSMMEARKELWHPVLVFLDEAHLFCPEKGMGESEATDAVIDLAGRGRKRGFTLVAATQRIGKFNKSALAELHNKFIGFASLDTDVKRAAFELGKTPKDALDDFRALKPGDFYAFGPALQFPSPTLFKGTLPRTKLPKAGHRKLVAPPKPTDKIRALLPQLADLPKEVEQKAKTEADLRKELAEAQRKLADATRGMVSQDVMKTEIAAAFQRGQERAKQGKAVNHKGVYREAKTFLKTVQTVMDEAVKDLDATISTASHEWRSTVYHRLQTSCDNALETIKRAAEAQVEMSGPKEFKHINFVVQPLSKKQEPLQTRKFSIPAVLPIGDSHVSGPEKRILDAIAWLETANGKEWQKNTAVAYVARYSPRGGSYLTPRSRLSTKGLIEYGDKAIKLTDTGRSVASFPTVAPTSEEIHSRVLSVLDGPMKRILEPLIGCYPAAMSNEEVAGAAGYTPRGGSYLTPRSRLKTLGLIDYTGDGVRASKDLFV